MRNFVKLAFLIGSLALVSCSEDAEEIVGGDGDAQVPVSNTILVPADQPTIQAGIDAAKAGDTVLVAAGTYGGEGNRDIQFGGKSVALVSESGPGSTIIDCEADTADMHYGFEITLAGDSAVIIDGFTIRGAFHSQGSAINIRSVDPVIKNCVFAYSASVTSGGAIRCKSASPIFQNCTFAGNSAPSGAVAYLVASSSPQFVNCIMAFSTVGEVIVCSDNLCLPTITCSNIYGCEDGDWIECIAAFADSLGNFSSDPMFCDTAAMDLHVEPGSPCAPANNSCGVQIGALEAICPP